MTQSKVASAKMDQQPNSRAGRRAEPVQHEEKPRLRFIVAALGASAGGLETYSEFLAAMPPDSGMAFVLIQHLPPDRQSMLADILGKRTKMPLVEIEDGMGVEPNHVYVIRPACTLTIHQGRLHLSEPLEKRGHRHPIDDFFRSLAEEQRERAVAIVLSGMGSNGTAGAEEIKAVGGLCIAQDPESAKYPSMPQHLLDAGLADLVLRPAEIPAALLDYAQQPYVTQAQLPGGLVSFLEHRDLPAAPPTAEGNGGKDHGWIERELQRVRDELQSTIQELQTSNEEMKASNEEATSINEELQSTNEELETSKEELQSLNEELVTVNAQLQSKMQELEATTNDLSSLLSSTDIAVVFLDAQLQIRRFTPATRDLFDLIHFDVGRPLGALARKFSDLDLLTDAQAVLDRLVPKENEVMSESGHAYLRRVLPYRTSSNHIDGVVITFVDITARRKAEEALRQAKAAAEAANAAKDQFLANLSHELRTPLSAMLLWTRLIQEQPSLSTAEMAEAIEAISRSAEEQLELIEDLVDTSRIVAGKLRLEFEPAQLVPIVQSGIAAVEGVAKEKQITVVQHLDPSCGVASVDPNRLQQVVWNVVSNAIKFSPPRSTVEVTLFRAGDEVELTVVDSGRGIAPEFLPQVFERFGQETRGARDGGGGLGLGLAITKQIVEMHQGSISVTSEGLERGTTVKVHLLAPALPEGTKVTEGRREQHGAAGFGSVLAGRHVLLVEDNPNLCEVLARVLREAGAEVAVAMTATAALAQYRARRADFLVSDIWLPEADGFTLLGQIRELEEREGLPPVPAVAVTASPSDQVTERALSAGFVACLSKPLDPLRLLASIVDATQATGAGR